MTNADYYRGLAEDCLFAARQSSAKDVRDACMKDAAHFRALAERVERDKAVAARTILYHHRLAPTRGQTIGKQTGCGIAGAGSAERQDKAHRSRWKRLLRGRTGAKL